MVEKSKLPAGSSIRAETPLLDNLSAQYPGLIQGRWSLADLFGAENSRKLLNGETVAFPGGWSGVYDKQSGLVRLYYGSEDTQSLIVKIEGGNATELFYPSCRTRTQLASLMQELESTGVFKKGFSAGLGLTPEELAEGARFGEKMERMRKINTSLLEDLPASREYRGRIDHTRIIREGDAVVMAPGEDGCYTYGAGPCSIVIAVARDASGNVVSVGMAHFYPKMSDESISDFLKKAGANGGTVEVHVISGETNMALRVMSACENAGVKIAFFNADLTGTRTDAAMVDSNGKVYYGTRRDIESAAGIE